MNGLDGFQRRTERKKEQILQAAIELFGSRGMKAVSVAEIAERAGVSPVSIYNYFGNKANLARQIVYSLFEKSITEIEQLLESDLPFAQKFQTIVTNSFAAAESIPLEKFDSAALFGDPEFTGYLEEFAQTKAIPYMLQLVDQGKKAGAINPELSAEAIVLYAQMFRRVLESDMSAKLRHDLGYLYFYGLLGTPPEGPK